jgi:hypothetical protein
MHTPGQIERVGHPVQDSTHPEGRGFTLVVVYRFAVSPQAYCLLGKQNIFPELYGCPNPGCPFPGRLRKHGFYSRWAIILEGAVLVWIQRYLCPHCGRTTSLLPSFLAPHFQISLLVLSWILHGLHQLKLSTHSLVSRWPNLSQPLSRQNVQHIRRRLKKIARLCLPLLGGDETDVVRIEELLVMNLPKWNGIDHFAHAFFKAWSHPFLSTT